MLITLEGEFLVECLDPLGRVLWWKLLRNMITAEGLSDLLNVYFNGATQSLAWYIGLIDATSFESVDPADVMANHPGWLEQTQYDEAARARWVPSVGNGVASNAAQNVFTMSQTVNLAGFFVTSSPNKAGTTGKLWSAVPFAVPRAVSQGQKLRLTYTLRAAGGG